MPPPTPSSPAVTPAKAPMTRIRRQHRQENGKVVHGSAPGACVPRLAERARNRKGRRTQPPCAGAPIRPRARSPRPAPARPFRARHRQMRRFAQAAHPPSRACLRDPRPAKPRPSRWRLNWSAARPSARPPDIEQHLPPPVQRISHRCRTDILQSAWRAHRPECDRSRARSSPRPCPRHMHRASPSGRLMPLDRRLSCGKSRFIR